MNSVSDIWVTMLAILEKTLNTIAVNTWLSDIRAVELNGDCLVLYTPTRFKQGVIMNHYIDAIRDALKEVFACDMEVKLLCEDELDQLELLKKSRNTDNNNVLIGSDAYTFDTFVVGSSNKFAFNGAKAVVDKPGILYNPLFIYSQPGLGKTHLIYAIANATKELHPELRICYVKGDQFTNELIEAIRKGTTPEFRAKYRECDLLLVDDVQFIAGKDSTQEEFFHTFNTLFEAKKQIVLTSDRPPQEMKRLETRLTSRFEQGLICDIQPPDYETRVAIVRNKAMAMGLVLPQPLVEFIATSITNNVRQLEGSIRKILAYQDLMGCDLDVDTVIRAIREMIREDNEYTPSINTIIEETAKVCDIKVSDITGKGKTKEVAFARQLAMYLIRKYYNTVSVSLKAIGSYFSNRDHTTVLHSISRIEEMIKAGDENVIALTKDIESALNADNNY